MIEKLLLVFIAGGLLSGIAQILIDLTKLTPAKILVLYVCLGVLLFGVGAYSPLEEIFSTGVSLPLIGFGANIARGVKETIDEKGAIGILSGGLSASSAGITAALVLGLLASIFFKSSQKKL
jgi:stage V sporulation protein AE